MTNEEVQNVLEFVLQQQAQFAVNLQKLAEAQTRTENNVSEIAKAQAQTAGAQEHLNEVMAAMAEAQERTDGKLAETDDRLNALINTVERYISERRNGDATK